jgi:class 3 adenylate cyclase
MAVGKDIAVGGEDDARAAAAMALLRLDLEMQHRRTDLVDGADHRARIGIEGREVIGGRGGRGSGIGLELIDGVDVRHGDQQMVIARRLAKARA